MPYEPISDQQMKTIENFVFSSKSSGTKEVQYFLFEIIKQTNKLTTPIQITFNVLPEKNGVFVKFLMNTIKSSEFFLNLLFETTGSRLKISFTDSMRGKPCIVSIMEHPFSDDDSSVFFEWTDESMEEIRKKYVATIK